MFIYSQLLTYTELFCNMLPIGLHCHFLRKAFSILAQILSVLIR